MGNTIVEEQIERVAKHLFKTVQCMEQLLNETTLDLLVDGNLDMLDYYKRILSQCRKILVYSEEAFRGNANHYESSQLS